MLAINHHFYQAFLAKLFNTTPVLLHTDVDNTCVYCLPCNISKLLILL